MIKFSKQSLLAVILGTVAVFFWVGLQVYNTAKGSTLTKITEKQITALDPKLNVEVIENLKNGISFSEESLNQVTVSTKAGQKVPTPTIVR